MKSNLLHLAPGALRLLITATAIVLFSSASIEARTPSVGVVSSASTISEGGAASSFKISRDCCSTGPLTVFFRLSGTAASGADYVAIGDSVTIPTATTFVMVNLQPVDDLMSESTEGVTLSISTSSGYKISRTGSASVSILDNDSPSTPVAPSNLTASNTTQNGTLLLWTSNSTNETGFVVEASTVGTAYHQVGLVAPGITSLSVGGLTASTTYTFRVGATSTAGVSYSEPMSVTTLSAVANALYVSTSGSDSNSGLSAAAPLRTITAALIAARPGTLINIHSGTYNEHLITRSGGLPGQDIVLTSYNGPVTIDGSTLPWTLGANQNQGLVELRHPNVTLRGLRIVNSKNTGVVLDADNLTIENCEMGETQRHVISTDTKRQTNYPGTVGTMIRNVSIRNNVIFRGVLKGQGFGQALSLIADGFVIAGNTVRDNMTEGIDIWLGAKHGEVVDNTVYGNLRPGIYVDGASYVRIHRNRVYNNTKGIGISSENVNYSTAHVWVYNNLVYDHPDLGIFIWDPAAQPGFAGSQNVLIANNTLINNKISVCFSGSQNTATVINNLGQSTGSSIYDSSTNSTYSVYGNVWIPSVTGFVDGSRKDFRLLSTSPAVNAGAPLPILADDLGNEFRIDTDFERGSRQVGPSVDAGAFEYRSTAVAKFRAPSRSKPFVGHCFVLV